MPEDIPSELRKELAKAARLHQRAASDYEKCQEFNKQLTELLGRLEDAGCDKTADRLMSILIDCNPKAGSQCDKASRITDKMQRYLDNREET